jgi:hypothetical protein
VQVTDPSGGTVLGTSLGTTHPQPFVVDASGVATCLRLSAILRNPADNSAGYADTPSPGGEYKVWVSLDSAFANNLTKTDNFKVNAATPPDVHTWLRARKFYDANANGINDDGQLIEGWRMTITDGITAVRFTPVNMEVAPDTYTVTEGTPVQTNWMRTTANPLVVGLAAGMDTTVAFGNLCLGPGGGLTLGFWSNKNGQATIVAGDFTGAGATYGLNAQPFFANTWFAAGTGFGATLTTQKSNLRSWLLNGNAVDMRYMLSVQAAAMMLNVNHGFVSATALVYAPGVPSASPLGFTTVGALLTDARNALGGTDRPLQEAIKTAIDRANNNLTFVQPTPCAFSF